MQVEPMSFASGGQNGHCGSFGIGLRESLPYLYHSNRVLPSDVARLIPSAQAKPQREGDSMKAMVQTLEIQPCSQCGAMWYIPVGVEPSGIVPALCDCPDIEGSEYGEFCARWGHAWNRHQELCLLCGIPFELYTLEV